MMSDSDLNGGTRQDPLDHSHSDQNWASLITEFRPPADMNYGEQNAPLQGVEQRKVVVGRDEDTDCHYLANPGKRSRIQPRSMCPSTLTNDPLELLESSISSNNLPIMNGKLTSAARNGYGMDVTDHFPNSYPTPTAADACLMSSSHCAGSFSQDFPDSPDTMSTDSDYFVSIDSPDTPLLCDSTTTWQRNDEQKGPPVCAEYPVFGLGETHLKVLECHHHLWEMVPFNRNRENSRRLAFELLYHLKRSVQCNSSLTIPVALMNSIIQSKITFEDCGDIKRYFLETSRHLSCLHSFLAKLPILQSSPCSFYFLGVVLKRYCLLRHSYLPLWSQQERRKRRCFRQQQQAHFDSDESFLLTHDGREKVKTFSSKLKATFSRFPFGRGSIDLDCRIRDVDPCLNSQNEHLSNGGIHCGQPAAKYNATTLRFAKCSLTLGWELTGVWRESLNILKETVAQLASSEGPIETIDPVNRRIQLDLADCVRYLQFLNGSAGEPGNTLDINALILQVGERIERFDRWISWELGITELRLFCSFTDVTNMVQNLGNALEHIRCYFFPVRLGTTENLGICNTITSFTFLSKTYKTVCLLFSMGNRLSSSPVPAIACWELAVGWCAWVDQWWLANYRSGEEHLELFSESERDLYFRVAQIQCSCMFRIGVKLLETGDYNILEGLAACRYQLNYVMLLVRRHAYDVRNRSSCGTLLIDAQRYIGALQTSMGEISRKDGVDAATLQSELSQLTGNVTIWGHLVHSVATAPGAVKIGRNPI